MLRSVSTLVALATLALALPAAASAAQTWEDVSAQTGLAALASAPRVQTEPFGGFVRFPVRPDAKAPAFLIGFDAVGAAQTGVPCFDCVNGAQTKNNIGLTGPYSYIATGETAQYVLSFSNITNTGNCTLAWSIAAGKTVLDSFSYVLKSPQAGGSYTVGFNRNRPSYSGPAVVTAGVTCASTQTVKNTLYFQ